MLHSAQASEDHIGNMFSDSAKVNSVVQLIEQFSTGPTSCWTTEEHERHVAVTSHGNYWHKTKKLPTAIITKKKANISNRLMFASASTVQLISSLSRRWFSEDCRHTICHIRTHHQNETLAIASFLMPRCMGTLEGRFPHWVLTWIHFRW